MRLGEKGTLMNASWLRSLSLLGVVLTLTWLGGVARAAGPQAEEKSEDVEGLLKDLGDEKAEDAPAAEEAQPAAEEDATTEEAAPAEATPAETPAETPVEEPAAEETPAPAGDEAAPAGDDTEIPEAPGVEEAPKEAPPPSRPQAPAPRPRADASERPTRRAPAGNDDIFRELGLNREARREQAKELVRLAKDHMKNGELIRAEGRLDEAHRLDPENEEAERLLSQVRFELGDQRGTIAETARWVADLQKVQRDQARTVILRLLNEGHRLQEEGDYAKAVDRYERAIEGIRNFHFNLNLDAELRDAQTGLAQSTARKKEKDEEERARFEAMLRDTARAERATSMTYLENQLRELRRKAKVAESEQDYDRAIMLYERILVINPRDEEALDRLESVKELNHSVKMNEHMRRAAENFEIAVLSIEESSVVYQQIFRYPDPKEWERITPKVPSIEDEIAATETTVEKEIKRKLEQPLSVGFDGELLPDALKQLQTFSGINFILTKEGSEAAADKQIKLDRYEDLPLKNVLNLLLAAAGEDFTYAIKEGAVVIGPKASVKQKEYLRFYEISDLIQEHPDFKAPKLALDELKGKNAGAGAIDLDLGGEETKASGKLPVDKLLELIKKEISAEAEGEGGVSILSGRLSARTSLENHLKLSNLLSQFRRASGLMVTVESRFLDIQDNFLEEIGVNIGNGNANFLPNNIPDIDGAGTSISPGWEWVDPSGDKDVRMATIGNLSQPLGTKVNPFNLSSSGGGAYQLNVLKAERYQLEAILTGVAKDQEIRKLNSPRVTAFNGQIAHTLVVNQAAYIQDLEVNQTGVIPVINPVIDVLNSGSILEVRPTVSHDRKYVVLEIQPTLAERLTPERAVLQLSGNFTVVPIELPVLSVTKIKTTITVPDGGTVLVGGLKREIANKAQLGIPGFLDVPFINLLFGRKGNSVLRSNLFVLINAKITIVQEEEARLFGA